MPKSSKPPKRTSILPGELQAWRKSMGRVHKNKGLVQCEQCREFVPNLERHLPFCPKRR